MINMIVSELEGHRQALDKTIEHLQSYIYTLCIITSEAIERGNKILLCGNGGSAADAQHIAAELTGRYKLERRGLPAIALTTDTSALTAIGNDYGYDRVFSRQLEALGSAGDVVIGISTSGNSKNVIKAFEVAKEIGCKCIGFSGRDGGEMNKLCDLNVVVPSFDTPRIQEMHILIGHIMCQAIEDSLAKS